MTKSTILSGLLLLAALFVAQACSGEAAQENKELAVKVRLADVQKRAISVPVEVSGRLASASEAMLAFKVGGLIDRIDVVEGVSVKKGDLLARLDQAEIEAYRVQAESGYEKAQRDLRRVEKLYEDSAATLEQLQNVRTAVEVARADLNIARFNEKHSRIEAPSDGMVLKILAEEGEMTSPGAPLFLFAGKEGNWVFKVGASDKDALRLSRGDSARVFLDAIPGRSFRAYITEIAGSPNPASGTYEVQMLLQDKTPRLLSGLVGHARVYPQGGSDFSMIPVNALGESEGMSSYVFSVSPENRAQRHPVEIEYILEDYVAVRENSALPRTVVTDGSAYLADNKLVEVVE